MLQVKCHDDKKLPEGACVVYGTEYEVEEVFINFYDQKTYIIKGVINEGVTSMGMKWKGYNAMRFTATKSLSQIEEYDLQYADCP